MNSGFTPQERQAIYNEQFNTLITLTQALQQNPTEWSEENQYQFQILTSNLIGRFQRERLNWPCSDEEKQRLTATVTSLLEQLRDHGSTAFFSHKNNDKRIERLASFFGLTELAATIRPQQPPNLFSTSTLFNNTSVNLKTKIINLSDQVLNAWIATLQDICIDKANIEHLDMMPAGDERSEMVRLERNKKPIHRNFVDFVSLKLGLIHEWNPPPTIQTLTDLINHIKESWLARNDENTREEKESIFTDEVNDLLRGFCEAGVPTHTSTHSPQPL